jgi:signal peptidase I
MSEAEHSPGVDWLTSLQSLVTTVVIAVFVITFVVQAFQIPSESMENTLLIGDYLLVDKLRYGGSSLWDHFVPYQEVRRGDIVVFHYPVNPSQHFVKRVVGVPGDHVRMIKGQVYVNGILLTEPYVRHSAFNPDPYRDDFPQVMNVPGESAGWAGQMKKWVEDKQLIVPEGFYFVLGDNRDESLDSRYWGFVPRENIIGRPLLIYWSVRSVNDEISGASRPGDKLYHFAYVLSHLFQITRWNRTFRLIT